MPGFGLSACWDVDMNDFHWRSRAKCDEKGRRNAHFVTSKTVWSRDQVKTLLLSGYKSYETDQYRRNAGRRGGSQREVRRNWFSERSTEELVLREKRYAWYEASLARRHFTGTHSPTLASTQHASKL